MRRTHTGRPGATVLHPTLTTAVRAVAGGTHTARCEIRRPGASTPGTFDPATGTKTGSTPHAPHWSGPCSIGPMRAMGSSPVAGDEALPTVPYVVALDVDAAPQLRTDDVVVITSVGLHGDPSLVGHPYPVAFIGRDSVTAERLLYCDENQS